MKNCHACLLLIATLAIAGCETAPPAPPSSAGGLSELMERPAERALVEGIRAYDDGQYVASEAALKRALQGALASPRDRATAHKLIAFIACTSQRMAECDTAFRAARAADPAFVLCRSEAGHPLWGPVFRRIAP
jgi:Tfp pilus assembly protein PilF